MKYSPQQLAHVLALLFPGDNPQKTIRGDGLSESEKKLLSQFKEQIEKFQESKGAKENILMLPEYRCQTEEGVLASEPHRFVYIMTHLPTARESESLCSSFILHLNNCFQCYETFVSVMREYFHETQKFNDPI